jgi:predicted RNA-binding protein with PUA-like domain
MASWLFKSEPDCYSYKDLERDGVTLWDGVTNALARKHLRSIQPGDHILYYHTGGERAVVGLATAVGAPVPDPSAEDANGVAIEIKALKPLARAVTLARIRADDRLADWDLLRLPRLSVVPVTAAQWKRVEELAKSEG